jgi:hypothetical protein
MRRSHPLHALPTIALVAACASCRRSDAPKPKPSADPGAPLVSSPVTTPGLAPTRWRRFDDPGAIGLPFGCTLARPVQKTPMPRGAVRFVTPPNARSELVVAVDENGDGTVDRAGVLDAQGRAGAPYPWTSLDAPPVVARSATAWIAADSEDVGAGRKRAMLWIEPGRLEPLVEGERLEVTDAVCAGTACAVLTSIASASAGPGATLLVGDPSWPLARWTRTDLPGEERGFLPLSIVAFKDGVATVAMTAPGTVSVLRVENGRATPVGRIDAPFGAYDVALGNVPVAILPGESIEEPCRKDGFLVNLARPDGKVFHVDGDVPPENVVARPLGEGFVVAWLAPVSCRHRARDMVRAFLVSPDGVPASSTMSVADAHGFALGTNGNAVDLWLAVGDDLVWIQATCGPPGGVWPNGGTTATRN